MKPFFQFDTEETRQNLLSRARNVAFRAIQQFEMEWTGIRFLQLSDTVTFKIETDIANYLLRIHSDRVTKEEILSEAAFLDELRRKQDLIVPEGIRSSGGSYVVVCETEAGYKNPYVSLSKWVEGEQRGGELTEDQVYRLGVMIGRLHEASADFVAPHDFVRPHWGSASFGREVTKLERYYSRFLSSKSWEIYQEAIEKIVLRISGMPRDDRKYGLIHADLHSGNVVFHNGKPNPIDFGRCGYGYFLYDVAASLLELDPVQRRLLIRGYEEVIKLDKEYISDLECFFIMNMIRNYCHHSSNPLEIPNLIQEQKYALAYLDEYINDRSFMFKSIEPIETELPR